MQQFSFNPAGIFSLKDTLKIYKGKKIRKIRKPSGLSLNPLFKKECHLLSDKLESMDTFFFSLYYTWGTQGFPQKKFSSFGPAVCPAIANIYKYI